jgi:hypothetical protein
LLKLRLETFRPGLTRGFTDNLPAPFPGKWPTRIAWHVRGHRGVHSYIGKPTPFRVNEFMAHFTNEVVLGAWFDEFDRKHSLYHWDLRHVPRTHPNLFSLYHFWRGADTHGLHLTGSLTRKRLGSLWVYSPYRALSFERKAHWFNYARAHTGLPLPKATPIPDEVEY